MSHDKNFFPGITVFTHFLHKGLDVTVGEEWILFKESHDSWSPPRTQTGVGFVPTKIRTPEADHTHGYSPCGSGLSYPNRRHPHWLAQTIWIEIHSAAVNLSDRLITTFPMVLLRLRHRGIKTISHVAADRDLVKGICCNHPGGGISIVLWGRPTEADASAYD